MSNAIKPVIYIQETSNKFTLQTPFSNYCVCDALIPLPSALPTGSSDYHPFVFTNTGWHAAAKAEWHVLLDDTDCSVHLHYNQIFQSGTLLTQF